MKRCTRNYFFDITEEKELIIGERWDFKNNQLILNKVKFNISRRFSKNSYIPYVLENNRIKFVRIIRKPFNNGYHYYAELVMEGASPKKVNMGDNDGGIDIGTSTIAFSSNDKVMLKELAPNAKNYDKKIAFYQQKMDKSKYISNFDNYNKDGTIRKNTKKTLIYVRNKHKRPICYVDINIIYYN